MKHLLAVLLVVLLVTACGRTPQTVDSSSSTPSSVSEQSSVPALQESSSSQSQPEEATPSSSQSSSTAPLLPVAKTWWQEGLSAEKLVYPSDPNMPSCGDPYSYYWLYDNTNKLSISADSIFFREQGESGQLPLLLDTAKETDDIGKRILNNYFFEIVALDDTKYTGEFYEKGILLTQSLPGKGKGRQVKLAIADADYAQLTKKAEARFSEMQAKPDNTLRGKPAWLTMMRRSRIQSLVVTDSDGVKYKAYDPFGYIYEDLASGWVGPGKSTTQTSLQGAAHAHIEFNNGLVYEVYYTDTNILINASDAGSMIYETQGSGNLELMNGYAWGMVNPRTGKPVIYLYPTQPTDCTVQVDYGRFTYSYPSYNGGWNVTAYPDGRLINKADNSQHYYLFWEGNRRIDWDFSSGFVVKGSDTQRFLLEKLAYLGLTPREYNDFITYWVPQMQHEPYNLITFAGEQYDALAPLTVTPAPDSILRVHMVFKSLDAPIDIPPQELTPFERSGFTVVEWGGTNANDESH